MISLIEMPIKKKNKAATVLGQQGFSLVEILVALFLVTIMVTSFTAGTGIFSTHQRMLEGLDDIERSIRFSSDEAAVRNTVIRIHFDLDKNPQEFSVEFGPDQNFILPKRVTEFGSARSLEESKREDQEVKKLNKKFSKVKEFQNKAFKLNEDVRIIAIGSSLTEEMVIDGEASIFFYPTGEKDSSIIVLASDEEMASLSTEAFTLDIERKFISLEDENPDEDFDDIIFKRAKEIVDTWRKR